MAKIKTASSQKATFGKKKSGRASKTVNKHARKEKKYRGQGR